MFLKRLSSGPRFVIGAFSTVFFLAAFLLAGDAAAGSAALDKVIKGAKKEGTLKLLWTEGHFGADVGIQDMLNHMNKRYGTNIKLQFTQGRSFPANLGRLTQEYIAKQPSSTDAFLGSGSHMMSGLKSGLLMKVDWEALMERPAPPNAILNRVNPQGVGMAIMSRVVGIVYNTNLVKGDDIPKSIEDVMNPKWKGQIAITPYLTGFIGCNSLDKLASGEFAMLIFDCGRDATVRYQRRGAPMGHAVPKEIVRNNVINLGVPTNAEHPNVGKLFIAFQHTKVGQKLLWEHGAYDLQIYPGSKSKELVDKTKKKYPNAKFVRSTAQRHQMLLKKGIKLRAYQKKFKKIVRGRKR